MTVEILVNHDYTANWNGMDFMVLAYDREKDNIKVEYHAGPIRTFNLATFQHCTHHPECIACSFPEDIC